MKFELCILLCTVLLLGITEATSGLTVSPGKGDFSVYLAHSNLLTYIFPAVLMTMNQRAQRSTCWYEAIKDIEKTCQQINEESKIRLAGL